MFDVFRRVARFSRAGSVKVALTLCAALGASSFAAAADRTFGGQNGRVSYNSGTSPNTWAVLADPVTKATSSYGTGIRFATFSPTGNRVAFYNETDRRVYVANTDFTSRIAVTPATPEGVYVWFLRWSPDGSKIAYIRALQPSLIQEVWVINNVTTSTAPVRLSGNNETCSIPDWDRDSTWLTYTAQTLPATTDSELYIQRPNGTQRTALTDNSTMEYNPRWAPNGSGIAFSSGPFNQTKAFLLVTEKVLGTWYAVGTPFAIGKSTGKVAVLDWSPDSTKILSLNGTRILVLHAPTLMTFWEEKSTGQDTDFNFLWSPDGTKIAFRPTGTSSLATMNHNGTGKFIVQPGSVGELNSWQRR